MCFKYVPSNWCRHSSNSINKDIYIYMRTYVHISICMYIKGFYFAHTLYYINIYIYIIIIIIYIYIQYMSCKQNEILLKHLYISTLAHSSQIQWFSTSART